MFLKRCSFYLADVDIFIGFLDLKEQLKMPGQWFFATVLCLFQKSKSIPQQTFPSIINKATAQGCFCATVGCSRFSKA